MNTNNNPASRYFGLQYLVIAVLACLPGFVFSQDNSLADSLLREIKTAKKDTTKVNLLTDLAWELLSDDPQKAVQYADSALVLAQAIRFKKGEGNALNFKGVVEDKLGNSTEAIRFFQQALAIREALSDKAGVASLYNNLGNLYENTSNYADANSHYRKSLLLRRELGDTVRALRVLYNLAVLQESEGLYQEGLAYIFEFLTGMEKTGDEENVANGWNVVGNIKTETERFHEALSAYNKALSIHQKLGNEWEVASALTNIAIVKDAQGEEKMNADILTDSVRNLFMEAIGTLRSAEAIRLKLEDKKGLTQSWNNIGYVLKNLGSFYKKTKNPTKANESWKEAEAYLRRSLAANEKDNNKAGVMEVMNGLGDIRRRQDKYEEALVFTKKYYAIAVEINDEKYQQNGLKDLARVHFKLGDYKTAYQYLDEFEKLKDKRFNEQKIQDEERKDAMFGDRKKEEEIMKQEEEIKRRKIELEKANTVRNSLLGGGVLLLLLAVVLFNRNNVIRREKQRSENLLLNILPAQTAEELKKNGKAKARRFENVTVLFTDFQSFTTISEMMSPEDLVAELDECFRAFDEITTRYQIEKIKTIGDAYLCAAGVPMARATHAEDAVNAALEMQDFMSGFGQRQSEAGKPPFICRIGLHSGPVVAGVVGEKKFAYDIWGDTVNLAARMEQSGGAGKVNISQNTFDLVKDKFKCSHRGKVSAKNKGELDMYFVDGRA